MAHGLSDAQLEQWRTTGTVVAAGDHIFSPMVLKAAAAEAAAAEQRFAFPSREAPSTNELALSAELGAVVHQLLGTSDVRLFESLVFPPAVAAAEAAAGAGCRAAALLDPPASATEAVHVDIELDGDGGTVTLYRSDVARPPAGAGALQRCGYRRADAEWIAGENSGWGVSVSGMPRDWVPSLTVEQRNLFSFPPPGSDYWTDDTIAAVSHHYASSASGWSGPEGQEPSPMDMSDYIAAKSTPADMQVSTAVTHPPPSLDNEAPTERTLEPLPDRWHFKESTRWATPEATLPIDPSQPDDDARGAVLTEEQVARWHADGFVVVQGIWPESLIDAAVAAAATLEGDDSPVRIGKRLLGPLFVTKNIIFPRQARDKHREG